jgi:hydrogenase maturation factor
MGAVTWVTAFVALIQVIKAIVEMARDNRERGLARAQALQEAADAALADIRVSREARDRVRARNRAIPRTNGLPDDGFRRD